MSGVTPTDSGSAPEPLSPLKAAGVGYTLATGKLFCDIADFHSFAEYLHGGPILTHEFADAQLWSDLRELFEERIQQEIQP